MNSKNELEDRLERLEQMLLSLAKETWVMRDRQKVLESLLEAKDIMVEDELDRMQPNQELERELNEELDAFIKSLLFEPLGLADKSDK